MAESSKKGKEVVVEEKKEPKNKAKALNAQSLNGARDYMKECKEVEEDNGDLSIQDLEDKINALDVKIKGYQNRIGTKTEEKIKVGGDITEQQNKQTETGREIEELDLRKGELMGKKGKLGEDIVNLDLQKEELVKEERKLGEDIKNLDLKRIELVEKKSNLGKDIKELKKKGKKTGIEIADLEKKENTLVEEKGKLANELDEKKKMRTDNLEKGNKELVEGKTKLAKDNEKLKEDNEKLKEDNKKQKKRNKELQDKYDGRCCSCCSIC